MPNYRESSPYADTNYNETNAYLDHFRVRPIPASSDDVVYHVSVDIR